MRLLQWATGKCKRGGRGFKNKFSCRSVLEKCLFCHSAQWTYGLTWFYALERINSRLTEMMMKRSSKSLSLEQVPWCIKPQNSFFNWLIEDFQHYTLSKLERQAHSWALMSSWQEVGCFVFFFLCGNRFAGRGAWGLRASGLVSTKPARKNALLCDTRAAGCTSLTHPRLNQSLYF